MQTSDQTKNKRCKFQEQDLNEAYKWFSYIDIFTMSISKKNFLEALTSLHESSGVYLIPLTKNEKLYENKYCIKDSLKLESISVFNVTKNKEIAKYTDTRIGITSQSSKIYLKIKDETVFTNFDTFFNNKNKNVKIQIKVKLNDEMKEFVVMEMICLNEKSIKITTDPEYFFNSSKDLFLDKFPEETYLSNYKTQHFFTLELFSKICSLNISPEKNKDLNIFTIDAAPPLFLLSKRFQKEFILTFKDFPNSSISFKVSRDGEITTKTPYPVYHYIDIVFKGNHRPLNGFLEITSFDSIKAIERAGFLASKRFIFKDLTISYIEKKNTFEIIKAGLMSIYINKFKFYTNNTVLKECRKSVDGKILLYFKSYNKLDKASKLILNTTNQKTSTVKLAVAFGIDKFNLSENEACKKLLYKIQQNFNGIIFFKILEPKLEEVYYIFYFNFNKTCIISTNNIKNIPIQWRQVIEEYEP